MQKIRTTVKIAGKEYNISGYDPEEYVQRVAAHVDRRMSELALSAKLPPAQLAILTAVNATDEAQDEDPGTSCAAFATKTTCSARRWRMSSHDEKGLSCSAPPAEGTR